MRLFVSFKPQETSFHLGFHFSSIKSRQTSPKNKFNSINEFKKANVHYNFKTNVDQLIMLQNNIFYTQNQFFMMKNGNWKSFLCEFLSFFANKSN